MTHGEMAEMAEIGSLGAKARATKCPVGRRKVTYPPTGVFVCIPKKPCPVGYRFNAKQFTCVARKKRQPRAPRGVAPPKGPTGAGWENSDPGSSDTGGAGPDATTDFIPGSSDTGGAGPDATTDFIPGDGQQPGSCMPGQGFNTSTGRCDWISVGSGSGIDPITGQPYPNLQINPMTGQPFPFPYPRPIPFPFGGGGGGAQFDDAGGSSDAGGGGGDDFIPSDVQMNLTPPGMPQAMMPQMMMPEGGDAGAGEQEFASGGTEAEAYQPEPEAQEEGGSFWDGLFGMSATETAAVSSDVPAQLVQWRDIALESVEKFQNTFKKPVKPPRPVVVIEDNKTNIVLLALLGAGLGYLAYKTFKK